VDIIENDVDLKKITTQILKELTKLQKQLQTEETSLIDTIIVVFKEIQTDYQSTEDKELNKLMNAFVDGSVSSAGKAITLNHRLYRILSHLDQLPASNRKYQKLSIEKYWELKEKIAINKKTSVAGAYLSLLKAYNAINDLAAKNLPTSRWVHKKMMSEVLNGDNSRQSNPFRRPLYLHHLTRLHNAFLGSLSKKPTKLNATDEITFSIKRFKDRQILLNNKYLLSTPNFCGENDNFFEMLYDAPDQLFIKQEMRAEMQKLKKTFHQILNQLGFKGELRKIFFPIVNKDQVMFRNYLTDKDMKDILYDKDQLLDQLSCLKQISR